MFSPLQQELGLVKPGEVTKIYFPYTNISYIKTINTPCSCSNAVNDPANSRIVVDFTPNKMSPHLITEGKGQQYYDKHIYVTYVAVGDTSDSVADLSFTSYVNKYGTIRVN